MKAPSSISLKDLEKLSSGEDPGKSKDSPTPDPEVKSETVGRVFRFPIRPCAFRFPWERSRRQCPDGAIRTSDPKEIEYLEGKVEARLCYEVKEGEKDSHAEESMRKTFSPPQTKSVPVT